MHRDAFLAKATLAPSHTGFGKARDPRPGIMQGSAPTPWTCFISSLSAASAFLLKVFGFRLIEK